MSIISTTDFILNEALPIDKLGTILQGYIDKYERKILTEVLGYELYKDFKTAIDSGSPDAEWTDLRDGAEYTYNNKLNYYEGIKVLIVDYVYFRFSKENTQANSAVNIKRIATENAENADPSYKQSIAWNEMVDNNCDLYQYITGVNAETADTYENFEPVTIEKITHFGF